MVVEDGYKQTDAGVIPSDWNVEKLGNVAIFFNGKAHENYISDIGDYVVVNSKFISSDGKIAKFSLKNDCKLSENDITIVMSDIPNGKALAKCFIIDKNDIYALNQRIGGLRSLGAFPKYLFYQLNRNTYFLGYDSGSGQTNLRKQEVLDCPVILPPLPEQTAIATALSDMDALIAQTEKLIEKKKAIKQGVMQELLRPKEGWVTKKLGEVCEIVMGQSPLSQYYNVSGNGLPLIQGNADIKKRKTIIRSYSSNITKKGKPGDIIMTVRAPVGEIALAEYECCLGRGVCSIRYKNKFIYHYLIFIENYWGRLSSGSTFDSVNSSQIKELAVSMPLKNKEQIEISEILTDLDDDLELTETKLQKLKLQKQGMMQALLTGKIRLV